MIVPLILAGLVVGLLVLVGFILLVVPGLFLLTIFAVVAPVIVVERAGVFEALGRSRALVKGNGWNVFGVIIVAFLITFVISAIFGGIGAAIGGTVVRIIFSIIANTLTAPIAALVGAVLYFTLRGATHRRPPATWPPRPTRRPRHRRLLLRPPHSSAAARPWPTSSHRCSSGGCSTRWRCGSVSAGRRRWSSRAVAAAGSRCCR